MRCDGKRSEAKRRERSEEKHKKKESAKPINKQANSQASHCNDYQYHGSQAGQAREMEKEQASKSERERQNDEGGDVEK